MLKKPTKAPLVPTPSAFTILQDAETDLARVIVGIATDDELGSKEQLAAVKSYIEFRKLIQPAQATSEEQAEIELELLRDELT